MKTAVKVMLADLVLLTVEYFAVRDFQWRLAYAASPHAGVHGYTPAYSYSILTQVFTMTGGSLQLVSPITLDWIQTVALILVAVNLWFVYETLKTRRMMSAPATSS